jgi:hypothetical protein
MTTTWTLEKEQICKSIGNRAGAFVWLCNRLATSDRRMNTAFSFIVMVGSYVFGTSGIPVLFAGDQSITIYINLAIQIAMILMGAIATTSNLINYEKRISAESWSSGQWSTLYLQVANELNKDAASRQDYETFYSDISDANNANMQSNPDIPNWIITEYQTKMSQNALTYDELYGETVSYPITTKIVAGGMENFRSTLRPLIKKGKPVYKLSKYII